MRRRSPCEVGLGVGEAVDVVDAHAGEGRVVGEAGRDGVDHLGHGRVFGANGDEIVDREESPNVAPRIAPPHQLVVLLVERLRDRERLGAGGEREAQWPVSDLRAQFAVADRDATGGEHVVERIAELRHEHTAVGGGPVDVEPCRSRRVRSVAEHLPPPTVQMGLGGRHVIRHVVDHHAESVVGGGVEQLDQARLAAEVGPNDGVIDDVVAVEASRAPPRRPATGRGG